MLFEQLLIVKNAENKVITKVIRENIFNDFMIRKLNILLIWLFESAPFFKVIAGLHFTFHF